MALTEFTVPDIREWLEYTTFSAVNHTNNTGRFGRFIRAASTGYTDETILLFDVASILFSTVTNVDLEITAGSKGSQTVSATGLVHKQNKNSPSGWLGTNVDFDTPFAVSAWPTALVTLAAMLNTGTYTFLNTANFLSEAQGWLASNPKNNWGLIVAINFGALGWWLSLDSCKLKITHTPPTNVVWGGKYAGYSDSTVSWCRMLGGTSPTPGSGKKLVLKSVSIYVGDTHTEQCRLAVYQGGDLDDPVGASLVYDFGQTSGSATEQWLTINHPGAGVDLAGNEVTWIAAKANGGGFTYHYTDDSTKSYDFQSARGRWDSTSMSEDETAAFESTIPLGGSFSGFWYPMVLQYAEEDIAGGVPVMRRRRSGIYAPM